MNIKGQGHSLSLRFNIFIFFFFFFFLETVWSIEEKFHVAPPGVERTKIYSNGPIWPPCSYMVKTLKLYFSGTKRPMTLKIGMLHRVLEYYQVWSNDDPGLTLYYFTTRSNLVPLYVFICEKGKTMYFSETIVVSDTKAGICSQLNEYMKLYGYQHSRSFMDLSKYISGSTFLNFFSSIATRPIEAKFHVEFPGDGGNESFSNGPGHMTKIRHTHIW